MRAADVTIGVPYTMSTMEVDVRRQLKIRDLDMKSCDMDTQNYWVILKNVFES